MPQMFDKFTLIDHINNTPDHNNLGSVNYEYMISKTLVSIEEYCAFLNNIAFLEDPNRLYKSHMQKHIERKLNGQIINYSIVDDDHKNDPITHLNIDDSKRLCNWLHNDKRLGKQDHTTTESGVYDMSKNLPRNTSAKFWIPNENEWYKAAYYDPQKKDSPRYWKYTNRSDIQFSKPITTNYFDIDNFGNYFYQILEDYNNETLIRGGAYIRQNENAHASCRRSIHRYFLSYYIGLRLCKNINTKNFSLRLHNTYGDGWKSNYLQVIDKNNNILIDDITLESGYGPKVINIQIPSHHSIFYINYTSKNKLSYENYYELYDDLNAKGSIIYKTEMYNSPPNTIMVNI